jgi:hypothetical protein
MLISDDAARALDTISLRERDVLDDFSPAPEAAPPSGAYFMIDGGNGRTIFSRTADFSLRDGTLVDGQGRPVLGFARPGDPVTALRADSVDAALGLAQSPSIDEQGFVSYERSVIEPRTGRKELQREVIGRIALARFPAGTKLPAPAGVVPFVGSAGDGNFAALDSPSRAASVRERDLGLQRLQEAYLSLDAIRAAGKAQGSIEKTTMDLLK